MGGRSGVEMGATPCSLYSYRDDVRPSVESFGSSDDRSLEPTRSPARPGPARLARRRRRRASQIRTYCSSLRRLWRRWVFGGKIGRWRRGPRANPGWR